MAAPVSAAAHAEIPASASRATPVSRSCRASSSLPAACCFGSTATDRRRLLYCCVASRLSASRGDCRAASRYGTAVESMALPAPVLSSLDRTAMATSIWGGCMGGVLLKALRSSAMHGANMFNVFAERRKHGRTAWSFTRTTCPWGRLRRTEGPDHHGEDQGHDLDHGKPAVEDPFELLRFLKAE